MTSDTHWFRTSRWDTTVDFRTWNVSSYNPSSLPITKLLSTLLVPPVYGGSPGHRTLHSPSSLFVKSPNVPFDTGTPLGPKSVSSHYPCKSPSKSYVPQTTITYSGLSIFAHSLQVLLSLFPTRLLEPEGCHWLKLSLCLVAPKVSSTPTTSQYPGTSPRKQSSFSPRPGGVEVRRRP